MHGRCLPTHTSTHNSILGVMRKSLNGNHKFSIAMERLRRDKVVEVGWDRRNLFCIEVTRDGNVFKIDPDPRRPIAPLLWIRPTCLPAVDRPILLLPLLISPTHQPHPFTISYLYLLRSDDKSQGSGLDQANCPFHTDPEMNPESPIAAPPPVPTISTNPKAAAQAAADAKNIVRRKLTGYVGFANLPNQWHRKSVRKGFNFNVMVVGMLTDPRRLEHVLMGVGCR